jgi:hypothetical protein
MNQARGIAGLLAAAVGLGIAVTGVEAQSVFPIGRSDCVQLAKAKRALESAGIEEFLKRDPAEVARVQGERGVKAMGDYIEIREKVLFRCPPNVLNATAAPLEERLLAKPPLPGKGPAPSRPAVDRRSSPLPLPTPRPI